MSEKTTFACIWTTLSQVDVSGRIEKKTESQLFKLGMGVGDSYGALPPSRVFLPRARVSDRRLNDGFSVQSRSTVYLAKCGYL